MAPGGTVDQLFVVDSQEDIAKGGKITPMNSMCTSPQRRNMSNCCSSWYCECRKTQPHATGSTGQRSACFVTNANRAIWSLSEHVCLSCAQNLVMTLSVKFGTSCLVFEDGNAVSTNDGMQVNTSSTRMACTIPHIVVCRLVLLQPRRALHCNDIRTALSLTAHDTHVDP